MASPAVSIVLGLVLVGFLAVAFRAVRSGPPQSQRSHRHAEQARAEAGAHDGQIGPFS